MDDVRRADQVASEASAQTGQLKFLHKFWLSGIPPAAAGGSFNPGLQGARNALESHRLPPVGLRRIFRVLGSLGLNNPPAAAGGILVNITCVETLAGQFALPFSAASLAQIKKKCRLWGLCREF